MRVSRWLWVLALGVVACDDGTGLAVVDAGRLDGSVGIADARVDLALPDAAVIDMRIADLAVVDMDAPDQAIDMAGDMDVPDQTFDMAVDMAGPDQAVDMAPPIDEGVELDMAPVVDMALAVDMAPACVPNEACATGLPGICAAGRTACPDGALGAAACEAINLGIAEACDGLDNDCDGSTDESLAMGCYDGPGDTAGRGACREGQRRCVDGAFGACENAVVPQPEACDGVDSDCDGAVDEGEDGAPIVEDCYSGPDGTLGNGVCRGGQRTCAFGGFGACVGEVGPGIEICDSVDNDCNGGIDDVAVGGCDCVADTVQACATVPAENRGVGRCQDGTQRCRADGTGFGACDGEVGRQNEQCDGVDDDCDGTLDEDVAGVGAACRAGIGACAQDGVRICDPAQGVLCDAVAGIAADEVCDGIDNDCDGETDEALGLGTACSAGEGACRANGQRVCGADGTVVCDAQAAPAGIEACNAIDDDCDGNTDEALGLGDACLAGQGLCQADGVQICGPDGAVICDGDVGQAQPDVCDGVDNDCDGSTDEGWRVGEACGAGIGACRGEGERICDGNGAVRCSAVPNPSQPEACNAIDDDCDGRTDERLGIGAACIAGQGACAVAGVQACGPDGAVICEGDVGAGGVEVCNGLDDDCDGSTDEAFGVGDACAAGVGACRVLGAQACDANGQVGCDAVAGVAGDEQCNAIDDDCDGTVDEGFDLGDPCVGGEGQCQVAGTLICGNDGLATCSAQPGNLGDETCNDIDDDCDGSVDEGFNLGDACAAGGGACRTDGTVICDGAGAARCSAEDRAPERETCNDFDDDCDGQTDEGFDVGAACSDGIGACRAEGVFACADDGEAVCTAQAGDSGEELCNGLDDDCDGALDEGFNLGQACAAGIGPCRALGERICDGNGATRCGAEPGIPEDELCDALDNDCDGVADEDLGIGDACTVGIGACETLGDLVCDGVGGVVCDVEPGIGSDETCNQRDDDCDGATDEAFALGDACTAGEGLCATDGARICDGAGGVTCDAEPGAPIAERCNAADDDCDGNVDEIFRVGDACRVGQGICQADGALACDENGGISCAGEPADNAQDETCNDDDDDCDGTVDEGTGRGDQCVAGVGACRRVGAQICDGAGGLECSAVAGQPGQEACNVIDDDCDGFVDEGAACDDVTPPDILIVHPGQINLGEEAVIRVILNDDFDANPIARLTVNGAVVQLDAENIYRFTPAVAGRVMLAAEGEDADGNISEAEDEFIVLEPGDVDPPFVRITAPADGTELAGATEIRGTLLDANFAYYEIDISPDMQNWQTIGGGVNGGEDVPVGTLDPTVLPPGYAFLRLTGFDVNDRSSFQIITVFVPETASVGDTRVTIRDFQMPLKGFPITLDRSYDSRRKLEVGDFGHGWFLGQVDIAVVEDLQSNVMVVLPSGDRKVFGIAYNFPPFFPFGSFAFVAPAGSGAMLEALDECLVVNTQNGPACFDTGRPPRESLTTYQLTTRDGTVWVIDQDEGLQSATDREGNRIEYLQDAIRSTLGPQILLVRDGAGRVTQMTDPRGGVVTYEYDGAGDLVRVVDQAGGEQRYSYDDAHALAEIVDPEGNPMVRSEYDEDGRKVVDIDALGNSTTYAYDIDGRTRTVTDRRGGQTLYTYDAIGQVTERESPGGGFIRMSYNPFGQLINEETAPGQSLDYDYDADGNQREVTDQRGVRHMFNWDQGQLIEAIDGLGHRIQITRDAQGRVSEVTNASGGTVVIAYDVDGNRDSVTDAMGGLTQFTYDALGNVTGKQGDGGFARAYVYDAAANLTSMFDSANARYEFEYDAVGRMIALVPPDGQRIEFTRDGLGRLIEIRDADGAEWGKTYSPRGELVQAIDPNDDMTAYVYDGEGALTETRYANGDVVQFVITPDGFNAERIDPLGNSSRYEFSPAGEVLARVDRNARRIEFEYDQSGNVNRREYVGGPVDTWEFDLGNRLVRMARGAREWLLEYDDDDRLLASRGPDVDLTYTYDLAGRRTRMVGPDGQTTYDYNGRGRLSAVTAPGAGRIEYERDGEGRVTRVRFPNGVLVDYLFDIAGRPLGFATSGGNQVVEEQLELDLVGRPTRIVDEDDGQITLEYDSAGQLTRFGRIGSNAPDREVRYQYDARGTRIAVTIDGQVTNSEILGDARIRTEVGATNDYDVAGNTVERILANGITQMLRYDTDLHLVQVDVIGDGPDQRVAYSYDPLGRRIARTVDDVTTIEVVDSGELTWRLDDQGAMVERFVHGDRIDELAAYVTPAGALYPVLDTRGNVAAVYDAAGNLVARYSYDPWGARSLRDGDLDLPFGFGARPLDAITGLYDFRARIYAPDAGRFLQQDPESGIRARAITQHPYAYANNNPYTMRDPSGRAAAISYAFLSSRFVTGSGSASTPNHNELIGALIGFFHGFGTTALVFLANVLEIANGGGNILDEWGAALAATEAKMDEISSELERFGGLDSSGFAGSFVDGAKFEVGVSFSLDFVPEPVNVLVDLKTGKSINQEAKVSIGVAGGGFNSGIKEALNFIGLHGPR